MTEKVNNLTDQQIEDKDNTRFGELNKKTDRTEEETKELGELKERHGSRSQKRIDRLTWEKKTALEEKEAALRKQEELEARLKEVETKPKATPVIKDEAVTVGNKKYYTDAALVSMIQGGKITEQEALMHQQSRQKEEAVVEAVTRIKQEGQQVKEQDIRVEDAQKILKEHPEFSKTSSNHNPNDPLYKLSQELYAESYAANPKGLSLAIKRAKQILRINDTTVDRSDDLNLDTGTPAPRATGRKEETTLSSDEEDAAVKMYTRGDVLNPKTGRAYTENEAKSVALEAKKARRVK